MMGPKFAVFLLCLTGLASSMIRAAELGSYGADSTKVSVSGVSSGASMAVQLHVAYSSSIMGVGAVAGVPYYCAQGDEDRTRYYECSPFGDPSLVNIPSLKSKTEDYADQGTVDATSNLADSKVYLFSGTQDIDVKTDLVKKLEDYYNEFVTDTNNIKTVYNIDAGHAFITEDYGSSCGTVSSSPYINDCNYNMAYGILNHIYGNLVEPSASTTADGQFLTIDQTAFFPAYWPNHLPMDTEGHVYVPTGCASSASNCKLHVALHGCGQTASSIGDKFWLHTGYNEVAELNNIIILYPQAQKNINLGNFFGCWDWWGYSEGLHYQGNYATNEGWEMKAIKGMIDRILA